MSYATPLYYAAKSLGEDAPSHPRQPKQRSRRIRSRSATVATAAPNSAR